MPTTRALVACGLSAMCSCALAGPPPSYTLAEVGPRPLLLWAAYDIGAAGQVVGRSWNLNVSPPQSRAFIWEGGVMTTLDGPDSETVTEARCIDDSGVVYGGYADRRFPLQTLRMHPVRWVGGVAEPYANNASINSAVIFGCSPTTGVAVGWAKPFTPGDLGWRGEYGYPMEADFGDTDPVRAFHWAGSVGSMLAKGIGSHDDRASDINDAGQAAVQLGSFDVGGAAIFDPDYGLALLPGLTGDTSWTRAFAINASGVIVGYAQAAGGLERPVMWSGGALADLGLLPGFAEGQALDINDAGVIIGGLASQSNPFGVRASAGFVWINGAMHNLNDCIPPGSAFTVSEAIAINNAGQILVVMDPFGFTTTRFAVLTPIP